MEGPPSRVTFDVSPAAIGKIVAAAVLVWLWFQLWQLFLLITVAVFLAVALDPFVTWMAKHHLSRALGASMVGLALVCALGGFFALTGSSLVGQAQRL